MKKVTTVGVIALSLASGSLLFSATVAADSDKQSMPAEGKQSIKVFTQEAREKVKGFGLQLKRTLKHELQTNGFESAVNACNLQAPVIEQQNTGQGWAVSRTALKVRNSDNAPSAWEEKVLQTFESQVASGENPKTIEYAEVVDGEFRYMKAIPTGKVCLACHGASLQPELKTHISSLYPEDQAIGFSLGQLRGAFSVTKFQK